MYFCMSVPVLLSVCVCVRATPVPPQDYHSHFPLISHSVAAVYAHCPASDPHLGSAPRPRLPPSSTHTVQHSITAPPTGLECTGFTQKGRTLYTRPAMLSSLFVLSFFSSTLTEAGFEKNTSMKALHCGTPALVWRPLVLSL